MKKEKYYLALDDYEKCVIINCLNNAKQKKFKMIYRED